MALTDIYRHGANSPSGVQQVTRTAANGFEVRISSAGNLAWVNAFTDVPMLNGAVLSARPTFGLFPLAFGPRGLYVYHADDIASCRLTVYDVTTRQPVGFASISEDGTGGIGYVTDSDQVVMNYDPPNFRRIVAGELWACCRESQNFIVGGFGNEQYPGALSKFDKRTGLTTRWLGYTPVPHDILETPDHRLLTFINGTTDSPEPDQLVWVDRFPQQQPPVILPPPSSTPDIALPLPLIPFDACWVGTTD